MKEERQKIERETLYEEVWSDPVTVVAARYGLSDVGLAKICKRLQIPLPRRGYWAKLKAGRKAPRAPLPTLDPRATSSTHVIMPSEHEIADRRATKEKAAAVRHRAGDVQVPSELSSPHPLVRAAAKRLKQRDGWPDAKGLRSAPDEVLNIEVTKGSLDRALLIADTLIKVLARQGISTSIDAESKATYFDVQGTLVSFTLTEHVSRSSHEMTPAEKRARDRYWNSGNLGAGLMDYPSIPRYDDHPTGRLTITLGRWPSRSWRDTDKSQLESRLEQVIVGLASLAEEVRLGREEKARQMEQRRLAEERYEFFKTRYQNEESAFKHMEAKAVSWERAARLRAYVEAVERLALRESSLGQDMLEWIAWARAKADWLDPLIEVCDPILDAPQPKRPGYW